MTNDESHVQTYNGHRRSDGDNICFDLGLGLGLVWGGGVSCLGEVCCVAMVQVVISGTV